MTPEELAIHCEDLMESIAEDSPYCPIAGGPSIKDPIVDYQGNSTFLVIDNSENEDPEADLIVPLQAVQRYVEMLEDGEELSFGAFWASYQRGGQ